MNYVILRSTLTSENITMDQLRDFAARPQLTREWQTVARLALLGCRTSRADVAMEISR
jgi:hypothetical protein